MFSINEFHFLRPFWLIAIPIFFWLIYISYSKFFKIGNWNNLIEPHLFKFLATKPTKKQKDFLPFILVVLVILFFIALAGPVWKKIPQPVFKKTQARVIVLDLSYSMLARDISPSRIERVRFKLEDLLNKFTEGETGLVCFAGDAFVISPLTNDPATIISMLPSLNPEIMPVPGSNPYLAIKLAVDLIDRSKLKNGHIILVTDGIEENLIPKIENIIDSNNLSILAVGTVEGSPINMPRGDFLKDKNGKIVMPKLNKKNLIKFTNLPNVSVSFMSIDDNDIEKIILSESKNNNFEEDNEKRTSDQWEEEGPWLLLIALPLLSFLFRKGVFFGLIILIFSESLINPKFAEAFDWNNLWLRADQKAQKYFSEGEMEKASETFKNQEWKGVAAYRSGDYEKAIENFSKSDIARSKFNLANSYAMLGDLKKSLEVYNKLLEKFPEHKDAKHNKDLIEKLIEQNNNKNKIKNRNEKKEYGKSSENKFSKKNEGLGNSNKNDNQFLKKEDSINQQNLDNMNFNKTNKDHKTNKRSKKNNNLMKNNHSKNPDKKNNKNNNLKNDVPYNSKQVENQILEQWLRKIPDDPGRLLRNKMHFEFQRRGKTDLKEKNYW